MVFKAILKDGRLIAEKDNNGAIVQFILFELMLASSHIDLVQEALDRLSSRKKMGSVEKQSIDGIAAAITALAGCSEKSMRIFSSNLNEGILAQTKNYCSYFTGNLERLDSKFPLMQRHANRAWKHSLDCLDFIRTIQTNHPHISQELFMFKKSFDRLIFRFQNLVKVVGEILHHFRGDENVLFFLLTHAKQIDLLCGHEFVHKLLKHMYPKGKKEIESLLIKKYTARGFSHLTPIISEKIAELEVAFV